VQCCRRGHGWFEYPDRGSKTEVETDRFFQQFSRVKPAAPPPEPRLVDGVQADFAVQRYVGLRRPFGSGDNSHRHGAQAGDQYVDRQHDDRMVTHSWQARVPDITSQRVHRLVAVGCNHSCWQWSRLAVVELVVSCREIHFTSPPVHQPQPSRTSSEGPSRPSTACRRRRTGTALAPPVRRRGPAGRRWDAVRSRGPPGRCSPGGRWHWAGSARSGRSRSRRWAHRVCGADGHGRRGSC